jgi:hypothetical protein
MNADRPTVLRAPEEQRPLRDPCVLGELLADGSMVLFHTISRQLMTLNPTAALVWEHCDGAHTPALITAELGALFPDVRTVAADVSSILRQLREQGMLRYD